jgi:hypothetical protein
MHALMLAEDATGGSNQWAGAVMAALSTAAVEEGAWLTGRR